MVRIGDSVPTPAVLVFDWHGTLVDTHDAMFSAMEEMLPRLEELGLVEHLLPEGQCRTGDDARLVRYIRIFRAPAPAHTGGAAGVQNRYFQCHFRR